MRQRDHAGLLEPLQPLAHRRRRHLHAARQFGDRQARVVAQQAEQRDVGGVAQQIRDLKAIWHLCLRNEGIISHLTFDTAYTHGASACNFSRMLAATATRVSLADRIPPHGYFVVSAVFHYLGPAFAVLLFAHVAPLGVAWLRIASAAVIFALWRRPWRYFGAASGARTARSSSRSASCSPR